LPVLIKSNDELRRKRRQRFEAEEEKRRGKVLRGSCRI
jgi:hypothetical protein